MPHLSERRAGTPVGHAGKPRPPPPLRFRGALLVVFEGSHSSQEMFGTKERTTAKQDWAGGTGHGQSRKPKACQRNHWGMSMARWLAATTGVNADVGVGLRGSGPVRSFGKMKHKGADQPQPGWGCLVALSPLHPSNKGKGDRRQGQTGVERV